MRPRQEEVRLAVVVQEDVGVQARVATVAGLRIDVRTERRERMSARRALGRGGDVPTDARAYEWRTPDRKVALRGHTSERTGSAAVLCAGDEGVRPVAKAAWQADADAVARRVVRLQTKRCATDRDRCGSGSEEVDDDASTCGLAAFVQDRPAERVAVARAGGSGRRLELRHDDAASRDALRRRIDRRQRRQRHVRYGRPGLGAERHRQRQQRRHPHSRKRARDPHPTLPRSQRLVLSRGKGLGVKRL